MKLGKKPRVILIAGLITTLGVFTSSTYDYNNAHSSKIRIMEPVVINNIFSEEIRNFNEGIKVIDNFTNKKEIEVAVNTSQNTKQSESELSRGGSGLNVNKQQVKAQTVVQQKTKTFSDAANRTNSSKTINEVELFSRLVSAEADGEPFEGQLAVATVIMNRVKSSEFPNSISGVIMDKNWGYQFTPVLDGRINLPASDNAKKAVNMVLGGYRSFGADVTYFINPKKAVSTWIINHKTFFKSIGNHDFYH